MQIEDIYSRYQVPHIVRAHQLRVAAVGVLLGRGAGADVDMIARVGLTHDMGNILKMDLTDDGVLLPLIEPDTLEHLRSVRTEFENRYGTDEHAATVAIAKEIGLSNVEQEMIDNMRFSRTEAVLREGTWEMRIVKVADLRVAPYGIVSMDERLKEARERYRGRKFDSNDPQAPAPKLVETEAMCHELETLVCSHSHMDAASLTDSAAADIIEELKKREIS